VSFARARQITGGTLTTPPNYDSVTFSTGASGVVTLTVIKSTYCGWTTASKTIAIESTPSPSSISAPETVCPSSSGNQASVQPRAGIRHQWQIAGGTITSATTGDAITFQAGASGAVTLTVTAANSCGAAAASTTISGGGAPSPPTIAVQPTVHAAATATASVPARLGITHTWQITGGTITSATAGNTLTFQAGSSGSVVLTVTATSSCNLTAQSTATVGIILPAPQAILATTVSNRTVQLSWLAVPGAARYRIERALQLSGPAAWSMTVDGPATTSYVDETPASTLPTTYIYYVRAVDASGLASDRSGFDDATTATVLYAQPTISARVTAVKATDVVELRRAIDALRYAVNLVPAFEQVPSPSGLIYAADFTALVDALSLARGVIGRPPFVYTNGVPAPARGGLILAEHVRQLREALR
jgi:hypothetical protein